MSETNIIELGTPYMLRNDGVLLNCNLIHPGFVFIDKSQLQNYIDKKFDYNTLKWFINNSNNNETVEGINKLLNCENLSKLEIIKILIRLQKLTDEEFCRVRMSDLMWHGTSRDIYFRIASDKTDWSDLIWNVVYKYRNQIESVTICLETTDLTKMSVYCLSDGTSIDKLSTEEYLMSSGKIYLSRDGFVNNTFKLNIWRSIK